MDEPTTCLTTDDLLEKAHLAISSATETLSAFNFSETLVQREVHLVRLQVDIQLNKLENRAQLILKDLVRKENKRLEDILNQLHDILERLRSPTQISKDEIEYQKYLSRISSTIIKLTSASQRQRIKFKENTDIQKAFEHLESFGDFFMVTVGSGTKHRQAKIDNVNNTASHMEMNLPHLHRDTMKQTNDANAKLENTAKCYANVDTDKTNAKTEISRAANLTEVNPFTVLRALNKVQLSSFNIINDDKQKDIHGNNDDKDNTVSNLEHAYRGQCIAKNVDKHNIESNDNKEKLIANESIHTARKQGKQETLRDRKLKKNDAFLMKRSRSASPRSFRSSGQINGILKQSKTSSVVDPLHNCSGANDNLEYQNAQQIDYDIANDLYGNPSNGKCVTFNIIDAESEQQSTQHRGHHRKGTSESFGYKSSNGNGNGRNVFNPLNKENSAYTSSASKSTVKLDANYSCEKGRNTQLFRENSASCDTIGCKGENGHSGLVADKKTAMRHKRLRNRSINIPLALSREEPKEMNYKDETEEKEMTLCTETSRNSNQTSELKKTNEDFLSPGINWTDSLSINKNINRRSPEIQNQFGDMPLNNLRPIYYRNERSLHHDVKRGEIASSFINDNIDYKDSKPSETAGYCSNDTNKDTNQNDKTSALRQKRLRNRSINIPWVRSNNVTTELNISKTVDEGNRLTDHNDLNQDMGYFKYNDLNSEENNQSHSEKGKEDRSSALKAKRMRNRSINIPWSRTRDNTMTVDNHGTCQDNYNGIKPIVYECSKSETDKIDPIFLETLSTEFDNAPENKDNAPDDQETSRSISQFCTLGRNSRQRRSLFTLPSEIASREKSESKPSFLNRTSHDNEILDAIEYSYDKAPNKCTRKFEYQSPENVSSQLNHECNDVLKIDGIISDDSGNISDETVKDENDAADRYLSPNKGSTNRRTVDLSARLRLPSFDEMLFYNKKETS